MREFPGVRLAPLGCTRHPDLSLHKNYDFDLTPLRFYDDLF